MAVLANQITIPADGSTVTVIQSTPKNSNQISIRNTGTVPVLLGPTGTVIFPLNPLEFIGLQLALDDVIAASLPAAGSAGQLTILGVG